MSSLVLHAGCLLLIHATAPSLHHDHWISELVSEIEKVFPPALSNQCQNNQINPGASMQADPPSKSWSVSRHSYWFVLFSIPGVILRFLPRGSNICQQIMPREGFISWHFLLLGFHVWRPNQTVFGLFGSQTVSVSLSSSSWSGPWVLSPLPLSSSGRSTGQGEKASTLTESLRTPLRNWGRCWCWHCSKTQSGSPDWSASCRMPEVLGRSSNLSCSQVQVPVHWARSTQHWSQ